MELLIKKLSNYADLPLPSYQTNQSVGLDLSAAIDKQIILKPFDRIAISTGLSIQLPYGHEGTIRPRSGKSLKDGLNVILGSLDGDFRGECKIIVQNINKPLSMFEKILCLLKLKNDDRNIIIERGMRIAQLVITPYARVSVKEVNELSETRRGENGFGSTG